jgi:hypothetical protein
MWSKAMPVTSMANTTLSYKTGVQDNFDKNFSNWFMPSIGQWILAAEGLGSKWESGRWTSDAKDVFQKFQEAIHNAGFDEKSKLTESNGAVYWSTTQSDENKVWTFSKSYDIFPNAYDPSKTTESSQ